jgi:hypothetical protein
MGLHRHEQKIKARQMTRSYHMGDPLKGSQVVPETLADTYLPWVVSSPQSADTELSIQAWVQD